MNQRLHSTMMAHLTTDPIDMTRESIAINTAASAAIAARNVGRGALSSMAQTDGTEAFRMAQDILTWINSKQVELEGMGYGKDLESCQDAQEYHASVNAEILAYKREVDKCVEWKVRVMLQSCCSHAAVTRTCIVQDNIYSFASRPRNFIVLNVQDRNC